MIGANYSIFRCSSSRKKSDVCILKVPQGDDERCSNRKESITCAITKGRIVDKISRGRIMKKIFLSVKDIILKIDLFKLCRN